MNRDEASGFLDSFQISFGKFKHSITLTVIATILALVFFLISLLIWPYVYQVSKISEYQSNGVRMLRMGLVVSLFLIALSALIDLFARGSFSYGRIFVLLVSLGGIAFFIWMTSAGLSLIIAVTESFIGRLMLILLRVILAVCMAIVPSLIALGVSYAIRAFFLTKERISGS